MLRRSAESFARIVTPSFIAAQSQTGEDHGGPMSPPKFDRKLSHRGAADDQRKFAAAFLKGRLAGFEKDMRICLTGIPSEVRPGLTHAYFPALGTCCGMLEYLAGLYVGRIDGLGRREVTAYAKYLPQPDYDPEAIRVLVDAFRNAVAHRGIASGVWIDPHQHRGERRLTWRVSADSYPPGARSRRKPGPDHQRLTVAMSLYPSRAHPSRAPLARHSRLR